VGREGPGIHASTETHSCCSFFLSSPTLRTSAIIFIAFISLGAENFYCRLPSATFQFPSGSVGFPRRHLNYENLSRLAGAVFIDRAWKTLLPFALSASKHCPPEGKYTW